MFKDIERVILTWLLIVLLKYERVNTKGKVKKQQKENTCKLANKSLAKNIAETNSTNIKYI